MHKRWLVALVTSLAAAGSVHAQDPAKPASTGEQAGAIDPEAKAFIDRFRGKLKDITDLTCTVEQRMGEGDKTDTFTGDVVFTFERVPTNGAGMLKKYR